MGMPEKMEKDKFKTLVRNFCSSNDPSDYLGEIRDAINLSSTINAVEMQALLVEATNRRFTNETLSIDITLMALGLLEGFDNYDMSSEQNDGGRLLTARQIKFLQESNYLSKVYHGKYRSYKDLVSTEKEAGKKKTPLDTVIGTLGKKHGRNLNKVADKVYYEAEAILSYINENKKNYFEEYKIEGKTGIKLKLPKMENKRKDREPVKPLSEGEKDPPITLPEKKITVGECVKKIWWILVLELIATAPSSFFIGWFAKDVSSTPAVSQTGDSSTPKDSLSDPPFGEPMEKRVNIFIGGENTTINIDGGVYYINE